MTYAASILIAVIGAFIVVPINGRAHCVRSVQENEAWANEMNWKPEDLKNEVRQSDAVTYELGSPQYQILNPHDQPEIITENEPNYYENLKRYGQLSAEEDKTNDDSNVILSETLKVKPVPHLKEQIGQGEGKNKSSVEFVLIKRNENPKLNVTSQTMTNSSLTSAIENKPAYQQISSEKYEQPNNIWKDSSTVQEPPKQVHQNINKTEINVPERQHIENNYVKIQKEYSVNQPSHSFQPQLFRGQQDFSYNPFWNQHTLINPPSSYYYNYNPRIIEQPPHLRDLELLYRSALRLRKP